MGRDVKAVPMPDYPDIVPVHPERRNWTEEEYDRYIEEEIKKAEQYTEWPDV